jgi:hypothetical protein
MAEVKSNSRARVDDHDAQELIEDKAPLIAHLAAGRLPRDLKWADLLLELKHAAIVKELSGDELSVALGDSQEFFRIPAHGRVDMADAARLRRLFRSFSAGDASESTPTVVRRALVVIDHHEAKIYRIGRVKAHDQSVSAERPYDPFGFHRHLVHRKESHYRGARVPEDTAYFRHIGDDLSFADEVVLIGHGKGTSNEAQLFHKYLNSHNSVLAQKVTAIEDFDLSSLTEPEIERRLRK